MVLHRTLDNRNVAMTTPTFCIQIRRVKGRWLDLEKRGGEGRGGEGIKKPVHVMLDAII